MRTCPFCGSVETEYQDYLADGWMQCVKCEAQGPHSHTAMVDKDKARAEALNLWEKRWYELHIVKAVRFYANEKIYKGGFHDDGDGCFDQYGYEILDDGGETARVALTHIETMPGGVA